MKIALLVIILLVALITPTAAQEEEPSIELALRSTVTEWEISPTSESNPAPQLKLWIEFANTGPTAMRAYTGIVHGYDLFGRELMVHPLTVDTLPLDAGQTRSIRYGFSLAPLRSMDEITHSLAPDTLTFTFEPQAILFTDGRLIGTPR